MHANLAGMELVLRVVLVQYFVPVKHGCLQMAVVFLARFLVVQFLVVVVVLPMRFLVVVVVLGIGLVVVQVEVVARPAEPSYRDVA